MPRTVFAAGASLIRNHTNLLRHATTTKERDILQGRGGVALMRSRGRTCVAR